MMRAFRWLPFCSAGLAMAAVLGASAPSACAEGRLDANYRVTISGLPIGSGAWLVEVGDDHYTMAASGHVSGVLRAFSSGSGSAAVRGSIQGRRVLPSSYAISIRSRNRTDEVNMALSAGSVRELSVIPPVQPNPDRVPVTEAHKRGILDPISAGLAVTVGTDALGPELCQRTVPIFDGRQRFDLTLSFKRMEQVRSERGYEGPVVVCAVSYNPIGGYDPNRAATRFLRESREIEIAYAPIAGTRAAAMYRVVVPTVLGPAVVQATRFVSGPKPLRASAAWVGEAPQSAVQH